MRLPIELPANWSCAKHLHTLYRRFPEPTEIAPESRNLWAMALFELLALDEQVVRLCGWNPETGAHGDPRKMPAVVRKFAPFCCCLSKAKLQLSYRFVASPALWAEWRIRRSRTLRDRYPDMWDMQSPEQSEDVS